MDFKDILGFLAAFFTTVASLPQLIKIIKTKRAGDVSIVMFLMTFMGLSLWLYYGYLTSSGPLLVSNSISLVIVALIILNKLKYK